MSQCNVCGGYAESIYPQSWLKVTQNNRRAFDKINIIDLCDECWAYLNDQRRKP